MSGGVDIATLGIRLDASGATQQAKAFGQTLDGLATKSTGAAKASDGLSSAIRALGGFLAVRQIVEYADAWTNAQARIGLVTASHKEMSATMQELFRVSQQTRTSFTETADIYVKLARNANALGASQKDMIDVTRTLNQAFIVSGASTQAQNAALVQLGQAFSSGTLRGEELNSVLEQAPRLAQAIADGMHVTVGQLRALGAAGQLTSKQVFDALKSQREAVEREFGQMPVTIGQSLTMVTNELRKFVGEAGQASQATTGLASAFQGLAGFISKVREVVNAFFAGWEMQAVEWAANFQRLVADIKEDFAGVLDVVGNALALVPGLGKIGKSLINTAAEMRVSVDATRAAVTTWEQEQYKAILGIGKTEEAVKKATPVYVDHSKQIAETTERLKKLGEEWEEQSKRVASAMSGTAEMPWWAGVDVSGPGALTLPTRGIGGVDALAGQNAGYLVAQAKLATGAIKEYSEVAKNALRDIQSAAASFIGDFVTEGFRSFSHLWDSFKSLAIKTFSELASMKLMQSVLSGGAQAALGINAATSAAGSVAGVAAGLSGWGIAISGLALAATSLFGAGRAHAEAAARLERVAIEWKSSVATLRSLGQPSLSEYQRRAQEVQDAYGKSAGILQGRTDLDQYGYGREHRRIETERDAALARINADFFADIARQMNALQGPQGAFVNALADEGRRYQDNLASATALHAGEAALETIRQLHVMTLEAINKAEADRVSQEAAEQARLAKAFDDDQNIRRLTAAGDEAAIERARLAIDHQNRLAEAMTEAQRASELITQAMEEQALAARQAAAEQQRATEAARAYQDLDVRRLAAQGLDAQAADLEFQRRQQREIEDARTSGRGDDYLTKLMETLALEAARRISDQSAGLGGGIAASMATGVRRNQLVEDVNRITETTGARMSDYLGSMNIRASESVSLLRSIDGKMGGGFLGFGQSSTGPVTITVQILAPINVSTGGTMDRAGIEAGVASAVSRTLAPQLTRERRALSPSRNTS